MGNPLAGAANHHPIHETPNSPPVILPSAQASTYSCCEAHECRALRAAYLYNDTRFKRSVWQTDSLHSRWSQRYSQRRKDRRCQLHLGSGRDPTALETCKPTLILQKFARGE